MKEKRMRTYLILLFVTINAYSFVFCQDPEVLLADANSKMEIGDLKSADSLLQASLNVDQSFAPAVVSQSKIWLRKGEINKAIPLAEKAVNLDEEFRSWVKELESINRAMVNAMSTLKQGNTDLAFTEFQSLTEKYPYYSQPYYNMGVIKYKKKDIEGVAYYATQVLKIYPEHQKAKVMFKKVTGLLFNSGNKAYRRGDLEKAIEGYKKAIEYDENYFKAYYQLGRIEKEMGNSDQAMDYFNKVIAINSEHYKTWFTIAAILEAENHLDSALINYNKAIEINPVYMKPYASIGNIYTLKEDYKSAQDILLTAIQIDAKYPTAYIALGFAFSEEAKEIEDESKQKGLDSKKQVDLISRSQELFTKASEHLKQATELDDKNFDAWFRYASALNLIKKYQDASVASQKCIDLKKKFGGGWYEKGVAEFGKGNKNRALKYLEEANKLDRNYRELAQRKMDEIKNPEKYQK